MILQDIEFLCKKMRAGRFSKSAQLSLGQLIGEINLAGVIKEDGTPKDICFDFGSAQPTKLASWRGSYEELALGYELTGYDGKTAIKNVNAVEFLEHLKSAIGETFTGWKGGDYTMDEDTPVWVANQGNSGNTAIIGVLNDGWRLVLITAYCEY